MFKSLNGFSETNLHIGCILLENYIILARLKLSATELNLVLLNTI